MKKTLKTGIGMLLFSSLQIVCMSTCLLQKKFESIAQDISYYNYSVQEKLKEKKDCLTSAGQRIYNQAPFVAKKLAHIHDLFFVKKQHEEALDSLGDLVFGLCNSAGLRKGYIISFPQEIDRTLPIERKIALMTHAADMWCSYTDTLQAHISWRKYLADTLLYNFVSTKVAPKLLSAAGIASSIVYLRSINNSLSARIASRDARNPMLAYHTYTHNPELCDNEKLFIECKHKKCTKEYYFFDNHACNDHKAKCAVAKGLNRDLPSLVANLAKGMRFTLPFIGLHYLGKMAEEAQLPEYENRIRMHEKRKEEQRILAHMKELKTSSEKTIDFLQINGHQAIINQLYPIIDLLKHPFKYNKLSRGGVYSILFYGLPGTGKTMLARAIAKESGAPIVEISGDDILADDSKERLLGSLRLAEKLALERDEKSAIIYIDEIDCFVGNRAAGQLDTDRSHALSNLLSIFDGVQRRNPYVHILIIMTTNQKENLDPALLRPGRIDKKIHVGNPDAQARVEFFTKMLPVKYHDMIDTMVEKTDGLSGAQIVNIFDEAYMISCYEGRPSPQRSDYERAAQQVAEIAQS